jgi:co-chaperonin GroES (HSP10)
MAMRIRPIGTSLLIEVIERATRKSGLIVKNEDRKAFIGKVLDLSEHLAKNGLVKKADEIIFVGQFVDTPIQSQYIIDAEQIIGVLEHDENSN